MADAAKPPNGSPLSSGDDLGHLWDRFRAGGVALCPSDAAPLALSVDASAGLYRFVCIGCGSASAWFESDPDGIRTRAQMPTGPGHVGDD
jgi:hypothetical protein